MGIALYLVWEQDLKKKEVRQAVILFVIHLAFNAAWSIIFFGLHALGAALVEIILLWSLIVIVIAAFYKLNKLAAYLLVPYLFWVSFATILTYSIWILNRG